MHALSLVWTSHLATSTRHAGRLVDAFIYALSLCLSPPPVRPLTNLLTSEENAPTCWNTEYQGLTFVLISAQLELTLPVFAQIELTLSPL